MILVDTSVWIDHLRRRDDKLSQLLQAGRALAHPFVMGELALGEARQRDAILLMLGRMPAADTARNEEVVALIKSEGLSGSGIGFVDAHLVASVKLMPGSFLWTRDKRLRRVAENLNLHWSEA